MTANPSLQAIPEPVGSWTNFVNTVSNTANWAGRKVTTAGSAVYSGTQKAVAWVASFFQRIAHHVANGYAATVTFVKANSSHILVGGLALAAGAALCAIFNRIYGFCNSKPSQLALADGTTLATDAPVAPELGPKSGIDNSSLPTVDESIAAREAAAVADAIADAGKSE